MHAPGPYGRLATDNADLVNKTLLDAVDAGMPALRTYARDVEAIAEPDSGEICELLDEAESQLGYVETDRARDLFVAIEQLRGQLAVAPVRLAVAA